MSSERAGHAVPGASTVDAIRDRNLAEPSAQSSRLPPVIAHKPDVRPSPVTCPAPPSSVRVTFPGCFFDFVDVTGGSDLDATVPVYSQGMDPIRLISVIVVQQRRGSDDTIRRPPWARPRNGTSRSCLSHSSVSEPSGTTSACGSGRRKSRRTSRLSTCRPSPPLEKFSPASRWGCCRRR